MKRADPIVSFVACCGLALVFVIGLFRLGVKLREFQVDDAADYRGAATLQSARRVRVSGMRGRILDRGGRVLAESRFINCLVCDPAAFQRRTFDETTHAILQSVDELRVKLGRSAMPASNVVARHVFQLRSIPMVVWHALDEREMAVFAEHEAEFPGFAIESEEVRSYPYGSLASQTLGYVGRESGVGDAEESSRYNFYQPELRGRAGIEIFYDSYLRGVPGVRVLTVDANNYTTRSTMVDEPKRGLDLALSLDARLQKEAERQLEGQRGACAAIDPRTGEVLVLASAPGFCLNDFVPTIDPTLYRRLADDPTKPLLNRAAGGAYAPGSTFKPITALAALHAGRSSATSYDCCGVFSHGNMRLHCASRWGHGLLDMPHAIMKSCNPYFCNLALEIGTNALLQTARVMGLGRKTGLDLGVDMAGAVPDAEWKARQYHERWYPGDVVQMSIGQGMLLVSPLQMARVAGAIGVGFLVTPHLRKDAAVAREKLPFSAFELKVVRDGMRMVVAGDGTTKGTGWRGGAEVPVAVSGKTGTAEVGVGERRRKNTWFIAYAPSEAPRIAVAMVIENGETGGVTTAPRVAEVLKAYFAAEAGGHES